MRNIDKNKLELSAEELEAISGGTLEEKLSKYPIDFPKEKSNSIFESSNSLKKHSLLGNQSKPLSPKAKDK